MRAFGRMLAAVLLLGMPSAGWGRTGAVDPAASLVELEHVGGPGQVLEHAFVRDGRLHVLLVDGEDIPMVRDDLGRVRGDYTIEGSYLAVRLSPDTRWLEFVYPSGRTIRAPLFVDGVLWVGGSVMVGEERLRTPDSHFLARSAPASEAMPSPPAPSPSAGWVEGGVLEIGGRTIAIGAGASPRGERYAVGDREGLRRAVAERRGRSLILVGDGGAETARAMLEIQKTCSRHEVRCEIRYHGETPGMIRLEDGS